MSDDSFAGSPHDCPPGVMSEADQAAIEAALVRRIEEIDEGRAVLHSRDEARRALRAHVAPLMGSRAGPR